MLQKMQKMPEASGPLGLGRVFLILRQGGRVVPLSPCALTGGGSSWAHLAMRLRLAHLAGQMWGLSKGVAGSFVFPSPSSQSPGHASQVTPAPPWLLCGGKGGTHESHLTPLWGWGGSSVWGVSATPGPAGAWPNTEICFCTCAAELRGWKDHMVPSAPA